MAKRDKSTRPIQTLRETITAFEAATLLCLAKPGKEAVHRLRTSIRRIEAELEMLAMLPGLPAHGELAENARRLLKKLRRAAGRVRDLDVQRDLVRDEARGKGGTIREEARGLRRNLKRRREDAAEWLLRLLEKQRVRLPLVFEALLEVLAPAESLELSEARVMELAQGWYRSGDTSRPDSGDAGSVDGLHAIRKRAKLARYIAESAPEGAVAARRLGTRFEALQQSGGEWHDWLLLEQIAAEELGDSAKLPQRFGAHAESALSDFKRHIQRKI
jgi:CHAD domain-containing protein